MKGIRWMACAAAMVFVAGTATAQLGKGKGGGGGGSGSPPPNSGPKNPPQSGGPKSPPPKNDPPPKAPPSNPPSKGPSRDENPPPKAPPRNDPPPKQPPGKGPSRDENPPPMAPPRNPPQDPGGKGPGNSGPINPGSGGNTGGIGSPGGRGPERQPPIRGNDPQLGNVGQVPRTNPITKNSRNTTRNYGTVNNQTGRDENGRSFRIDRLPPVTGNLPSQVLREENVRRRGNIYRNGYWHYDPDWCDDYFWYPSYVFNPFGSIRCALSPWYYYGHLPGYIRFGNVIIINIGNDPFHGSWYNYRRPDYFGGGWGYDRRGPIDEAIDDLIYAFEYNDRRALSRLIPSRGRVNIYIDGRYDYTLESDDFYQLMLDAVVGTHTRNYQVMNVQTWRDQVEVTARHDFYDAWGRSSTVYHWYRLEQERRGYVITNFGTSANRW